MKQNELQYSAREAWKWLWLWIKENKKKEYREKYTGKSLAKRIGCDKSAISLWKKSKMNFEDEHLQKIFDILDEWKNMLSEGEWLLDGQVYVDENNIYYRLDYREVADPNTYIGCDYKCKRCKKMSPSKGEYCMYCGSELYAWENLDE